MSFEKKLERIMPNGRAMFLAWDQGMEHGPRGFAPSLGNEDPDQILTIALGGKFTGVVLLPGDAEKFYTTNPAFHKNVPLILKVNCKSELYQDDDPYSPLLFSRAGDAVQVAFDMDASAIGYTIYLGSKYEYRMMQEFHSLASAAHVRGLPVIAWVYPRSKSWELIDDQINCALTEGEIDKEDNEGIGKFINDRFESESKSLHNAIREAVIRRCPVEETPTIVAYAASAAARLGADIAKIKYSGDVESFRWAVRCAGKTKVVMSGGPKSGKFLEQVREVIEAGGVGVAVGRNVWQSERPLEVARDLREIIWEKAR